MARFVVSAAVQATAQDVRLFISVSGADNGLPRSGLAPSNFEVVSLAMGGDATPQSLRVSQAAEGPAGIYQLTLDSMDLPATRETRTIILAIVVSGDAEAGWADDRGQTIAVGTIL